MFVVKSELVTRGGYIGVGTGFIWVVMFLPIPVLFTKPVKNPRVYPYPLMSWEVSTVGTLTQSLPRVGNKF
jgi:hypothetical protein